MPYSEKPYEFVAFPSKVKREEPAGHHRFALKEGKYAGLIEATLTARRPVQVASGLMDVMKLKSGETALALMTKVRRRISVIPGSSLKGAVRSVVEAISPSCVRVVGWRTRPSLPRRMNPCSRMDSLCPACRLFGMSGGRGENYAGQVHFEDAVMVEGRLVVVRTPLLWAPARSRRGLPSRYLRGREVRGRKFYYHGTLAKGLDARMAAGTGAIFKAYIRFENLSDAELGLLLAALGQHPEKPFLLKVGAAKPVGMGSVKVDVERVALWGNPAKSGRMGKAAQLIEGEALEEKAQEWIRDAEEEGILSAEALEELWRILRAENLSRPSPAGAY
ncbi:MAG TPA: hypothetical protein EYP09_01365 [Anaerolineae bacterium]|nr:hypothetical protein [Anaerolineae bacterium]